MREVALMVPDMSVGELASKCKGKCHLVLKISFLFQIHISTQNVAGIPYVISERSVVPRKLTNHLSPFSWPRLSLIPLPVRLTLATSPGSAKLFGKSIEPPLGLLGITQIDPLDLLGRNNHNSKILPCQVIL